MKRTMFATASATILSLGLLAATPVMAQGVAQLQESVTTSIAQLGISTENVDMLTLRQLQEIELTVNGTETNDVKRGAVERIMGDMPMSAEAAMQPAGQPAGMMSLADASGLQDAVMSDLANLDIDEAVDVDMLTVGQLSQITLTMNGNDSDATKRDRVRKILGLD